MITKRQIRNVSGTIILVGHLLCISTILYKWGSVEVLVNLGGPMLPVTAYALASLIRFSASNSMFEDDKDPALFLFMLLSIVLPAFVAAAAFFVILSVDTSLLGPSFDVDQGRAAITWLETVLGASYAGIVEGLFGRKATL